MSQIAIAMDLGTSGFRAQAIEISTGRKISTVITNGHPLPGANVIDHLHFALEIGVESTRRLILEAVSRVLSELKIKIQDVERLAVCGNPTQLSLFQGIEIRDLAYAGSSRLKRLSVRTPKRNAAIKSASEFPELGLPDACDIIIPPAVKDEIGADALALVIQSGLLNSDETAVAIDYGTNAEMVLAHNGCLYTASAAAGPALEGQHISCGTLAMPGAIADVQQIDEGNYLLLVLDDDMEKAEGSVVNLQDEYETNQHDRFPAKGITGTGVIAAIDQALQAGIVTLPKINTYDNQLHLGKDIYLNENDLEAAGKAIGAIRAGYFTLSLEAGIAPGDIHAAYLAGASGTYVDAHKSGRLGLVPPSVNRVKQVGNTSLSMACELALRPQKIEIMTSLANRLRRNHCMLAKSKTFAKLFLLELSLWTEGMPMELYREMLQRYRLCDLPPAQEIEEVEHSVRRDIGQLGSMGLVTLERIGTVTSVQLKECQSCLSCIEECPTGALSIDVTTQPPTIILEHSLCNGVACRRCERACVPKAFDLKDFFRPMEWEG